MSDKDPAELFAQAMRDAGFEVNVIKMHVVSNPTRFQLLLRALSLVHSIMDEESDGPAIDPREMLPSLGLMRMFIGELEEMLLTAVFPEPDGQREPDTVTAARKALADYIYSCGGHNMGDPSVYEPLIQALVDSTHHKAQRLTDEKLTYLLRDSDEEDPAPAGDSVVPPIFSQFLTQPDILS